MSNRNYFGITSLYYLMGIVAGLLGSIMVLISDSTNSSHASTGFVMAAFNIGALLGIALFHELSKTYAVNSMIAFGSLSMSLAFFLTLISHVFLLSLLLAALIGIGFGILDLGLAQVMTRTKETSIFRINLSNGIFGLGGISGALFVHFYDISQLSAVAIFLILITLLAMNAVRDNKWKIEHQSKGRLNLQPQAAVIPLLIATALYVAIEISAASWLPTLSILSGKGVQDGALATSLFYLFFTLGRFIGAPIARRFESRTMISAVLALSFLPLSLAFINTENTFWFVALTGMTLGPVFANTSSFLAKITPNNPGATAALLYSAMVGSLLIFPAIGYLINGNAPQHFTLVLLTLLAATLIFFLLSFKNSKALAHNE